MAARKDEKSGWRYFQRYANLGFELVVAVLIGAGGGHGLDKLFGTKPWFFLIGFVFGVAAGFLNIFRLIDSGKK